MRNHYSDPTANAAISAADKAFEKLCKEAERSKMEYNSARRVALQRKRRLERYKKAAGSNIS